MSRTSSGRRGWLVVALALAACGAAAGVWGGREVAPDEPVVVVAAGVAGFGLGGLVGMLVLGVVGLVRRVVRFARSRGGGAARDVAVPPVEAPRDEAPLPLEAAPVAVAPAADAPAPVPAPEPEPASPPPPPGDEPGWYPDPYEPGRRRYWDGRTWTTHVWRERRRGTRRRS